jgi:hypothetical protein
MAYQNSSPQIVTGIEPVTGKAPISKWWPIGFFCGAVFFIILGGGLIGARRSNVYYGGNSGEWSGGIACLVIGLILKFVFWVLLIIRRVQIRRTRVPSTIVYANAQANAEAGTVQKPQPLANIYSVPQPNYTVQSAPGYGVAAVHAEVPLVEKQALMRYCGQCGTGTTTPFCSQCGFQVPM